MSPAQESPPANTVTLIDELLAEQRSLTAVARFARKHEAHRLPAQARYYRDLIPLTRPRPGEQYAFEVDLDQCTGCKGCVTACHALNGLDEDESWRNVGLLVGGINGHAMQQTVTTACHHCVDPGCLNGCPVLAYEKDPVTGIVRHLDDQCIGCQYCVMKCPYDVPKYSARLGIVRKCDLCHQRLAVGEAPACVQACPNEAIRITVVEQQVVRDNYRNPARSGNRFLSASPAPEYTLPTTIYKTGRPSVELLKAADEAALRPQPAHWPLVFLLVLSQASVGLAVAAWLLMLLPGASSEAPTHQPISEGANKTSELSTVLNTAPPHVGAYQLARDPNALLLGGSAGLMGLALGIAGLHLGRPLKAWRAFLGWRTSWFSREAIAFGAYLGAIASAAFVAIAGLGGGRLHVASTSAAALLGLASVFCSLMLYVDTRREFWSATHTGLRFLVSTALLGLAGWIVAMSSADGNPSTGLAALVPLSALKLTAELAVLRHRDAQAWTPLKRTALLLTGRLRYPLITRVALLLAGGLVLPGCLLAGLVPLSFSFTLIVFILLLAGELAERYLFFTAVSPTQMPGGLPA